MGPKSAQLDRAEPAVSWEAPSGADRSGILAPPGRPQMELGPPIRL